ncbi:MAG: hypothetical protein FJ390_07920 [Verrucomicrobia bacterium]|nr:hypothetical protein [Verrucomicrobiota bacterium]
MPLESHYPVVQSQFHQLMNSVQEPSEPLHAGYYSDADGEEEAITEIHQLENSKAAQMLNLNIKHRV